MHYKIGTRGSKLALVQAEFVRDCLQEHYPQDRFELKIIKTKGDKIQNKALSAIGDKGLFVKEIEQELLSGEIHLAVHSMKDMPGELPDGLCFAKAWKREDPRDVLVLPEGVSKLDKSKPLGCSSLRRTLQLKKLYPDMEVKSIRGNLQTRLRKLDEGQYSALILAAAGLKRLGLESRINRYFTADEIIPAAGQGILAVQGRKGEDYSFLNGYCDEEAWAVGSAERAFVKLLDGGCSSPVAAHGEISGDELYLRGLYYNEKDGSYVTGTLRGNKADAESLGRELAETLRKKGENR